MSFSRYMILWWSDEQCQRQELEKYRRLFPTEAYDYQWMFFQGMDPETASGPNAYYPGIASAYEKRRWQVLEGDEERSWKRQHKWLMERYHERKKLWELHALAEAENIYFENHSHKPCAALVEMWTRLRKEPDHAV